MAHAQRIRAALVEAEVTYGTDPTPTVGENAVRVAAADFWNSFRPKWEWRNERPDVSTSTLIEAPPASPVGHWAEFTIPLELRGPGAAFGASSLPEANPLLLSFMSRSDNFTTDVTYSLASASHGSFTAWLYVSGPDNSDIHLYKMVGCRVKTMRLPLNPGLLGIIRFECMGMISEAITEVSLPSYTYNATVPPAVKGLALTIGGSWTPNWESAEIVVDTGLELMPSGNASDAIRAFEIGLLKPEFNVTAEAVALATYNPYTICENNTSQTIAATLGDTQYNQFDFSVAASYMANDPEPMIMKAFNAWGLKYLLQDLSIQAS